MKKRLFFTVIICMFFVLAQLICAENTNQSIEPEISTVFSNQLSSKELNDLQNKDLYSFDYELTHAESRPIMKIYNAVYWFCSHKSLDEILSYAEQSTVCDYVILDEDIRVRKLDLKEKVSIGISPQSSSYNYIKDLKEINVVYNILGNKCNILQIYCFEGFTSYQGASIYFVTNQGTFIKHYEKGDSQGVWFEEKQYQIYAQEYYNYISSPENNYNENGEPIGGAQLSFISFVNGLSINQGNDQTDESLSNNKENEQEETKSDNNQSIVEENIEHPNSNSQPNLNLESVQNGNLDKKSSNLQEKETGFSVNDESLDGSIVAIIMVGFIIVVCIVVGIIIRKKTT